MLPSPPASDTATARSTVDGPPPIGAWITGTVRPKSPPAAFRQVGRGDGDGGELMALLGVGGLAWASYGWFRPAPAAPPGPRRPRRAGCPGRPDGHEWALAFGFAPRMVARALPD